MRSRVVVTVTDQSLASHLPEWAAVEWAVRP